MKLNAAIYYLNGAASYAITAAHRLDAQDGWHLEHARALIDRAEKQLALCKRHIDRAQVERAERLGAVVSR